MWLCVRFFLSCAEKRSCHIGHGRFEGAHGSVLTVHTVSVWAVSPSLSCRSHLLRLSLSAHISFFLFSINNSLNNNDSELFTHGPFLPEGQSAWA